MEEATIRIAAEKITEAITAATRVLTTALEAHALSREVTATGATDKLAEALYLYAANTAGVAAARDVAADIREGALTIAVAIDRLTRELAAIRVLCGRRAEKHNH